MKRAFPLLGVVTACLLSYGLYQALVVAPKELTMGDVQRIFYYHVPSAWTAFILFFINFIASVWYLIKRTETVGLGGSRCRVLHGGIGDGTAVGATCVGDLVDVGRAAHFYSRVVADLRELSDAASIFRKRTNTCYGRGACDLRCTGRSTGLFLDLVFPDAAPATRHRWRRLAGPSHVDRAPLQLAGLFVFRVYGLLVALPSGGCEAPR
jgi:hypothetical protein